MRLGGVLLMRAAPRDVRPHDDERRPLGHPLRVRDSRIDRLEIVTVGDPLYVPTVRLEAPRGVVGQGELGRPIDRDAIVVVKPDQLAELQVTCERARLVRDALHEVAVGREEIGVVVDDRLPGAIEQSRELRFGDRHADGVPDPLSERSRRRFYAGRNAVLRVSRCAAPPLAELLDLVEREIVAREIKDAVEQHAGMARRQDKAIAVQPFGIRGIVSQMALPQHVRERRQRHCRAGMPRIGLLYGVHRERTDGVDAELIELHASDGGGLGHSNPDLAACHNLVRRSKPSTSSSTCCGDGDACAAIFSSSTSLGISWRPCFKLSIPI